jgi:hypothetical protein
MLLREAIVIHAKDQLELIQAVALPHMKDHDRKAVIGEYKRIIREKEPIDYARIKEDRDKLIQMAGFVDKRPKSP